MVLLQEVQVVRVDVELVEVAAVALVKVVELLNAAEVVDALGVGVLWQRRKSDANSGSLINPLASTSKKWKDPELEGFEKSNGGV